MFKSKQYFNRSSNDEHDKDQQTKGNDVKHHSFYYEQYKGKITYVAQPTNSINALSGRETEMLKRIESLEEWRAEIMKM